MDSFSYRGAKTRRFPLRWVMVLFAAGLVAALLAVIPTASGAGKYTYSTKSVTYNVSILVTNSVETKSTVTQSNGSGGTETGTRVKTTTVAWSGSFEKVGFRIVSGPHGQILYTVTNKPYLFPGTIDAYASYSWHDPDFVHRPIECDGSLGKQEYRARLSLSVYPRLGTLSKAYSNSNPVDSGRAFPGPI